MTRKFNIIVDGVAHEVEVEELGGSAAPVSAPAGGVPVRRSPEDNSRPRSPGGNRCWNPR